MSKVGRPMGKLHQDDVRSKIQVSQLVNVLTNHALGKDDRELVPTRLKAIEILLKKSLPDLSAIEHTGADGGAIQQSMTFNVRFESPKRD
jgi:hypothetical protein